MDSASTEEPAIATIAFVIEHEEGHLNPTFRLARRLAARGHRPIYLGLADGGDFVRRQGFEFVPILEESFPQGVVVTHAGLGTVKECILCGAPMAVFPIDMDQPDNARRVVHHGLGVSGDLRSFSVAGIAALVEQAAHPAVRESLERMRQRFVDAERAEAGIRLIEDLLEPGRGQPPAG